MTPQRVQFSLWCLFSEQSKASTNQSDTILHYKRIPVITVLWVLQPPLEAGHQSGNFYRKFTWAKVSSTCKAGKETNLCCPQLQLVCCHGQSLSCSFSLHWGLLVPCGGREEFPTRFLVQHPAEPSSSYRISSENSRHSQLFLVVLVLFCKFGVNSPPLSSLSSYCCYFWALLWESGNR